MLSSFRTRQVVHIEDIRARQPYLEGDPAVVAVSNLGGARYNRAPVPMLKDDELVGTITIYRQEVRPFTDKQITLLRNFAAQAIIAIENTRLLNELRQRTDELGRSIGELRALGEVSQAVNSTLDLENVLSTIVAKAAQLSGTVAGAIYVFDEGQREFHLRATYGMDQSLIGALTRQHIGLDEPNIAMAVAQGGPFGCGLARGALHGVERDHLARRVPRAAGRAAHPWRRHSRPVGCPPPHSWCIPSKHCRPDQDFRSAIGAGNSECTPIRKCGGAHPRAGKIAGGFTDGAGSSHAELRSSPRWVN